MGAKDDGKRFWMGEVGGQEEIGDDEGKLGGGGPEKN